MTRELIIEGQSVDISPDTDITLEYTSNFLGDLGKLNLSHSYTIKLPKTLRNARILDDPGNLGHDSGATRRYLSARYYRKGIDLMGALRAYILKTTADSYEITLVKDVQPGLQELTQTSQTLNDIQTLPTLTWVDEATGEVDYTGGNDEGGARFARYDSGLGNRAWPRSIGASHPCEGIGQLLVDLLDWHSVDYKISKGVTNSVKDLVVLAAPSHIPSPLMNYESGVWSTKVRAGVNIIDVGASSAAETPIPPPLPGRPGIPGLPGVTPAHKYEGWNSSGLLDRSLSELNGSPDRPTSKSDKIHILLNLRFPAIANASPGYISIVGKTYNSSGNLQVAEVLYTKFFEVEGNDWVIFIDQDIDPESYVLGVDCVTAVDYTGEKPDIVECGSYRDDFPQFAAYYVLDRIDMLYDPRFPITGNLPKIKQWDFVKTCAALLGWQLDIQNDILVISTYDEALRTDSAYDWTSKVDMADAPTDISYVLSGWAQSNLVTYKEEDNLITGTRQAFSLDVDGSTLTTERTYHESPFHASMLSTSLRHYKLVTTDKESLNETEDIDIGPRLLKIVTQAGEQELTFPKELQAPWLKAAHYAKIQEIVRKPVAIAANIRLHELDLAQLDLTRPVYLGQFGHYYKILKVQTSATDLCKVELLQIA